MPDVSTPKAEETQEVVEEQPTQPEEQVEQTQAEETQPEAEQAPETQAPAEPSADDLKAQLAAKEAEIEALKAAQAPEPEKPAPQQENGGLKDVAIGAFVNHIVPEAKRVFVDPNSTIEKQFDTIIDTTDKMLGAVIQDRINPMLRNLASANIEQSNELEIRDLRAEDPAFRKDIEPKVRAEISKMSWKDRANPEAVRGVYHKIIGAQKNGNVAPASVAPKPKAQAAASVLKDVSTGSPAPGPKANGIRLTKEQEADRLEIGLEVGHTLSPENYLAKLKGRQDHAKALGRKIPQTLREI